MSEQLTFKTIGGDVIAVRKRGKHYVEPRGYYDHPANIPETGMNGDAPLLSHYTRK